MNFFFSPSTNDIRLTPTSLYSFIVFALFLLTTSTVSAQSDDLSTNRWRFLAEPYMMFPNMNGTTGVGVLPDVDIDASVDDIFSKLQFGAMLYMEAGNDRWAVTSDIIYMDLNQDATPNAIINSGEVGAQQFAWEFAGLRKVMPSPVVLEFGIGGRINSLNTEVNIVQNNIGGGTTARNQSLSKTWFDPILIVRVKNEPEQKFLYQFRGDIGGFGIGSSFAWQIQAYAGYRFSKLFQVTAGYRVIAIDYDKGEGSERFLYDVDTFGPVIRFGFSF